MGAWNGNGKGQPQCEEVWGNHRGMVMVERVELQLQQGNQKKRGRGWWRLRVEAKVAVGDSGRQARLLTEGVGVGVEATTKKNVLEFATGRLPDNVDRSTSNKVGTQKRRVVVIAGPTAVGKSRVAIALAKDIGGEIISADSIQVALLAALLIPLSLLCMNTYIYLSAAINATTPRSSLLLLRVQ